MDALPSPGSPIPVTDVQKLQSTLSLQISRFSAHVARVNRLIASTPDLDRLLCTTTYTLTLLSSILPPATSFSSKLKYPISATNSALTRFTTALLPLISLLSDFRATLRLFSLFSIYSFAVSTLSVPPRDWVLRWTAFSQVLTSLVFQVLENAAHLGDKGVIGASAQTRGRWWLWSCRAWMTSTALEGVRLGREWALRQDEQWMMANAKKIENEHGEAEEEKEMMIAKAKEVNKWWRSLGVNAAYAPMTLHWSMEQGILNDGIIGVLGMAAGGLGLREAWRNTI